MSESWIRVEQAHLSEIWIDLEAQAESAGHTLGRRLPTPPRVDCFIGIETSPTKLRMIRIEAEGSWGELSTSFPKVQGLKLSLFKTSSKKLSLTILQSVSGSTEIFEHFVWDVYTAVTNGVSESAFMRVISRLYLWQSFFKAVNDRMSPSQVVGLYGELRTLKFLILDAKFGPNAVFAWTGPDSSLQDFCLGNSFIEVKTTASSGDANVKIASERQLETSFSDNLYLVVYRVDARTGGSAGRNIREVIAELRALLAENNVAGLHFEDQLLKCGYSDHDTTLKTRFTIRDSQWFDVHSDFPRIEECTLPTGVSKVSYTLNVAACGDWKISEQAVSERLIGWTTIDH